MGFRNLLSTAAILSAAVLSGCAAPVDNTDASTVMQIQNRIRDMATLRGADLDANIRMLGQFMGAQSVPYLVDALDSDSNPKVRAGCAQALGYTQDGRAVEPLASALEDSNDGVRFTAAYNLGLFRDARGIPLLLESLRSTDPINRRNGNQALMALTKLEFGYDPVGDPSLRNAAAARWDAWFREAGASDGAGAHLLPTEGAIRR